MARLRFQCLFDGRKWRQDVVVEVDPGGMVRSVQEAGSKETEPALGGTVLPALPNLHSHAFQRRMAGRAERRGPQGKDSFWTWRKRMYREAERLTPAQLEEDAFELYRVLRDRGFGSVAEFHYVHHQSDGTPYEDPLQMLSPLIRAANRVGIRLCLLPVLYQRAGFDAPRPLARQRRFVHELDAYLKLLDLAANHLKGSRHRLGIAFHSLRAVTLEAMQEVLSFRRTWDPKAPVHVHVAEQPQEVADCLAAHGRRPVDQLLEALPVDESWCLVHGTHTTPEELAGIAECGAVVGLCPSTEANLGDGIFDLPALLDRDGRFGIGTDAHVGVCPFEELRWLEYGQRLRTGRRVIVDRPTDHVGTNCWLHASEGGAQALGLPIGRIAPDFAADWLLIDSPVLNAAPPAERLDLLVFRGGVPAPEVWLGGRPRPPAETA
ncbi:MAG: formimidoylglutamate deiminase [Myxococcota bacterium]